VIKHALKSIHLEKKAIRVLGVAESFRKNSVQSVLAGIVLRSDLVLDGIALGHLAVSGEDATNVVISLYKKLRRNDINALMISGSVLSLYNIVEIEKVYSEVALPVLALSFSESTADLEANISSRFSSTVSERKIKQLRKLGKAAKIELKTGYRVFVRSEGISQANCKKLLDRVTLQGSIPEPIRVARLIAKAVAGTPK